MEISANLWQLCPSAKRAWVVQLPGSWGPCSARRAGTPGASDAGAAALVSLSPAPGLRGRSFSIAQHSGHSDGTPGRGPSPSLSTSGTECQPLCGPLLTSRRQRPRGERKTAVMVPPGVTQQHRLASTAARPSSDGTPRRALLPQVCSGHLPAVNSRSCPGIALQSPSPSSIPEDAGPCPGM